MCDCVLIWRAVHTRPTKAMEAESSRPKMQVMDPHGAGLVFRNYTRPSGPSGPQHSVYSPSVSLSLAGKFEAGTGVRAYFEFRKGEL